MKGSVRRYKLRQFPANLRKMIEVREKYQSAISEAKPKQYKSNTKFLNKSKDSTQFWHKYDKVLAGKQITLLSHTTLTCTSSIIKKYQRNAKTSTLKKLGKISFTWNSKMKLQKRSSLS